ncbi:MAG TPA: citrate/2-methylcitrate synthase, partial [Steroidobacteraceae bacterium]|nr:citrate/2-methylcitrate synthase [Steroidobacteraceae bacterium]
MAAAVDVKKGLEGVLADTTALSLVDGERGRLYYRGLPVESLAQRPFAAAVHLLVFGELPNAAQLARLEEFLWRAGQLPAALAASLRQLASHDAHPMATLQAITPLLAMEPPADPLGRTAEEREGLVIAARVPAAIALIHAVRQGRVTTPYPESRRYGERYLHLVNGRAPTADEVAVFECMQVLQLDHGFNASTFTARVVTSTLAPAASALSAAMGALYGPLHGAADQGALEMALEVGSPEKASDFVATCLATKRVVMGMGHREYRVVDPRAKVIKRMAEKIATAPELRRILDTLSAVEAAFVAQTSAKRRSLRANLEFYKGVVCLGLGIPKELFTATFAASRVFGWVAHIVEQRADNRIIR